MSVAKNINDLLGLGDDSLRPQGTIIDTALVKDDDDPSFDDDGMTFTRPGFSADDMMLALENPGSGDSAAELSRGEAKQIAKFSQPLTDEEIQELDETPFLGPELTWVDDPAHDDIMRARAKGKYKAMDKILDDVTYGEEPGVDSSGRELTHFGDLLEGDDDLGFGLSSLTSFAKKVGRGAENTVKTVARTAIKPLASLVKKFVPSRDAQKAALIKQTNARLVNGRMGFLAKQDRARGIKRPKQAYTATAKVWAASKLKAAGLPTSYTAGQIVSTLGGTTVLGSWWNPFSWFQTRTKYVVQNAAGEMAELTPEQWNQLQMAQTVQQAVQQAMPPGQDPNAMVDPNAMYSDPNTYVDPNAVYADPNAAAYADPSQYAAPAYADPSMYAAPGYVDPSQYAAPAYADPSMYAPPAYADPNAAYANPGPAYYDPNAMYGETMGNHTEDKDTLVFGDEGYDLVVGQERAFSGFANSVLGKMSPGSHVSAEKFKRMVLRRAQKATKKTVPSEADLLAATRRLQAKLKSKNIVIDPPAGTPPGTSSGAWLYQLNPSYWMKTPRERHLIDAEKANWEKTQSISKRNQKQQGELDAGRRALYQAEQARAAQNESQAIEDELKNIEESVSSGTSVLGGENVQEILGAAAQGRTEAKKNVKKCDALASKIEAGQKLSPEELAKLRTCIKMCRHLRKLHDLLHGKVNGNANGATPDSSSGENVQEILGGSSGYNDILGKSFIGGAPTKQQWIEMTALAAGKPAELPSYLSAQKLKLTPADLNRLRGATAATKKIMAHPNYGQASIVRGDDSMGFSLASFAKKVITAPLALAALPAAALTWGATKIIQAPQKLIQYGARQGGWTTPGTGYKPPTTPVPPGAYPPGYAPPPGAYPPGYAPPPGAPPMAMPPPMPMPPPGAPPAAMPDYSPQIAAIDEASRQRRIAASQRRQAAEAQSAIAQRQLQASADAANAEADALEAEAQARADASDAADADAGITPSDADSSGDSEPQLVLGADWFSGSFIGEVDDPKAKAIVAAAQTNTPTGKKIRAGATLYKKAKGGHVPSRIAISKMEKKAKAGDPQAKRDATAVRAGKIAVHAKGRAKKKIAHKSASEARKKRFAAGQKHMEAALADKLARGTRRRKLAKLAKVERRAALGDKKAKRLIAREVAKAKKGDKKAQTNLAALRLVKHVRTSAKTPQEARRIAAAGKLVKKARKGNKKALRQLALIQAASKKGQPNAKRAHKRLQVAAHLERAVATGKVSMGTPTVTKHRDPIKEKAAARVQIARIKGRVKSGIATQEEALGVAKVAQRAGLKQEAAELAMEARKLRSSKASLKETAAVVAAAENNHAEAQTLIKDTLASADNGDPRGIAGAGKLAAVKTIASIEKGGPMPTPIAEAMQIAERAQNGDPKAKEIIAKAGAAAQDQSHPDHTKAIEAAVAFTAAGAILGATAANAGARAHVRKKSAEAMGQTVPKDKSEEAQVKEELAEKVEKLKTGEGTYADGVRARELAHGLGKPALAAQISAIMPAADFGNPLSSLPEPPLPRITGWGSLIKESLKALLLATSDPMENYREGVRSRGSVPLFGAPVAALPMPAPVAAGKGKGKGKHRVSGEGEGEGEGDAKKQKAMRVVKIVDRKVKDGSAAIADLKLGLQAAKLLGDNGHQEVYEGILVRLIPAKM